MAPAKQSTKKRKHNADDAPSTPAKRINPLKVLVGPKEDVFFIHEDVICASSAFFKAACSNTWKENQEKTVKLPTADPNAIIWCAAQYVLSDGRQAGDGSSPDLNMLGDGREGREATAEFN
ncbi:uncharacterized protein MYCFIDRAFT_194727 [Pseudocercospora fijiensis CIRAD86]|uniref:BTB domain-containing protein n=1 Tax=Pseudocercospora fijiensis (strain CIRAD86) TaxID=383855 RepID=M3AQ97_PSEFD|nr:uncharacterized protein MYCFIDRAFT_194727 [Pseudocercospora fijiensis CIRAD86]EME86766.1 hypothetical protein MYCFIDRAFT_194727 [Pseudocercospora fijiensis CIRAD86]